MAACTAEGEEGDCLVSMMEQLKRDHDTLEGMILVQQVPDHIRTQLKACLDRLYNATYAIVHDEKREMLTFTVKDVESGTGKSQSRRKPLSASTVKSGSDSPASQEKSSSVD